jgi:hypothetical protein
VLVADAVAKARPSAALLDAITPTRRFAVVALAEIAPRGMTACQVEGVAHLVRSAAEIVSATTHEQRRAVQALALFGLVRSPASAVQLDPVPTPLLKSVARTDPV